MTIPCDEFGTMLHEDRCSGPIAWQLESFAGCDEPSLAQGCDASAARLFVATQTGVIAAQSSSAVFPVGDGLRADPLIKDYLHSEYQLA